VPSEFYNVGRMRAARGRGWIMYFTVFTCAVRLVSSPLHFVVVYEFRVL